MRTHSIGRLRESANETILLRLGALLFMFLGSEGHVWAGDRDIAQPNILVIITDQQFADVMGCAGCPRIETPAMDSLAKDGVRFTNAYVNYPVCMPERYAMFTGRLPCTRKQADIVGVEMPEEPYYGKSVLPFVLDAHSPASTHDYVVSEAEVIQGANVSYHGRALRTPEYKYHVWSRGQNREQLFDMINDPGETRNLAGLPQYAGQLQTHRELFAEWLRETDDTYAEN